MERDFKTDIIKLMSDVSNLKEELSELRLLYSDLISRVSTLEEAKSSETNVFINGAPEYVKQHVAKRMKEKANEWKSEKICK